MTALAASLDDYRWLTSAAATPWLAEAAARGTETVADVARLRQHLSPQQTHLVVEQIALRTRAAAKFQHAARMFFASPALEQATDEIVAAYKARRFVPGAPTVDFCCGVGGDLAGLAARGPVVGVDRDPIMALLAEANLTALDAGSGHTVVASLAAPELLAQADAWHIDPDRRPTGRRTTRVELHEPGPELIDTLLASRPNGAVKLAPAAELPPHWPEHAELEWISRQGICRQLVAWFGSLSTNAGRRRATVLGNSKSVQDEDLQQTLAPFSARSVVGRGDEPVPTAGKIGSYLFEPDAAVLAAKLQGVLAAEHGLAAIAPGVAYWTGDRPILDAALAAFTVLEVLPYDLRRVEAMLGARRLGRLEVKQRGTGLEPATVQRQLRVDGDQAATLLLARVDGQVTAIVARRIVA